MKEKRDMNTNTSEIVGHVPRLSKFQRYLVERIPRGKLCNATYNPRKITPDAKARLKGVLAQQGLLEAIVWNRTTGNLVGGHQRLSCLDALEGSPDYALDVCVVELDAKEEREANAALNNPSIQGVFDAELFDDFMKSGDFDFARAGFSEMELGSFLSDRPMPQVDDVQAGLKALGVTGPVSKLAQPTPLPREDDEPAMPPDDVPVDDDGDDEDGDEGDGHEPDGQPVKAMPYAVVIFSDEQERLAFYTMMGAQPGSRIEGHELMVMMGED